MTRVADYELVAPLRDGAHGRWWLARPPARLGLADAQVAVKVLHADGGEEAFSRMVRELRAYAAVRSGHLVTLLDAGHDGGRLFYAARHLPGGTLAAPAAPTDAVGALRAVGGAARGAHALHEAGIAHRDITPATVLLADDGAGVLGDLGLVQLLQPGQTSTGFGPVGSLEHTDPAVLRGERASRSSDLWSLGTTLHQAVTGRSVHPSLAGQDLLSAVRVVVTSRPVLAEMPAPVATVVERCLEVDPADRWATAEDLAVACDAAAAALAGSTATTGAGA